ncbi:glycine-rich protein [Streptomyces sp. NBC_01231]|nr:glycine-rich protein [Streptomyces sp. NBC_01231]
MKRDSLLTRRVRLRRGATAVALAALGAGGGWAAVPVAAADSAVVGSACVPTTGFTGCRLYDFTGDKADFRVPSGVTALDVRAWGQGGDGSALAFGGAGGYTAGALKVTPGETLSVAVAGRGFGDARGGAAGSVSAGDGGNSTAIRTSDGEALVIAAGGGGAAHGRGPDRQGYAGAAGGEKGQDASESAYGGKGADTGTAGAGGGNGASGGNTSAGGRGGNGGKGGGGGGGAGYAGGGGGAGAPDIAETGSGGGGSSYADPGRVSGVRLLTGDQWKPAAKDDPYWAPNSDPVTSGIGEGGVTSTPGGNGRAVIQWKSAVAPATLSPVSAPEQSVEPGYEVPPTTAVVRDKDGKPVEGVSVKFTIDDPLKRDLIFGTRENRTSVVLATDAQGRVQTPTISTGSRKGDFTIHATTPGGLSTDFVVHVRNLANEVKVLEGDEQQAEPGQPFPDVLQAVVTDEGKPAAGVKVNFRVDGHGTGLPKFEGKYAGTQETADDEGTASSRKLVADDELGTYTVTASVDGGASATFTVEVVEKVETDPSASPSASPSPSPSGSADGVTGGTGDDNGSGGTGTGGTGTGGSGDNSSPLSGALAGTGASGIGLMLGVAAALAALGVVAVRFSPRLRVRLQNRR